MSIFSKFEVGDVSIHAEVNRGHPPEFWAERATERILGTMHDKMPDHVRQQGEAFRGQVRDVIYRNILSALKSDRQTLAGELRKSGYFDIARDLLKFRLR